jgi:transcriptional regulator of acetoin/glycerol metabolism
MTHTSRPDQTLSTEPSTGEAPRAGASPGLAVVLECDRIDAGGALYPLEGVRTLVFRRGDERRFLPGRGGECVLELPDKRISSRHAALEKQVGGGFRLVDLGSSNGTFVGQLRVDARPVAPLQLFRVGQTLLCLVAEAGPAIEHGRAPWPFPTSSGRFAAELSHLARVSTSGIPLLLLGETGSGKEVIARAVHERSKRPGAFVAVNCGALPATLVEAQLFGHKKGAFSGALRDELGFVRSADGGTLLLDEVGDLPPPAQASLLRVLEQGEVTPVGAFHPVKVDLRVLAATHKPLDVMIRDGQFRADLYARLSGFTFRLPPLRERREDLGHLISIFARGAKKRLRVRHEVGAALFAHEFPLNVRELRQFFEAASALAHDDVIRLSDLAAISGPGGASHAATLSQSDQALRAELAERLRSANHNLTQVAREMGKARQQVQRWVKRFGL